MEGDSGRVGYLADFGADDEVGCLTGCLISQRSWVGVLDASCDVPGVLGTKAHRPEEVVPNPRLSYM